MLVEDIMNK